MYVVVLVSLQESSTTQNEGRTGAPPVWADGSVTRTKVSLKRIFSQTRIFEGVSVGNTENTTRTTTKPTDHYVVQVLPINVLYLLGIMYVNIDCF